jgi:hypothetical protein
MATAVPVAVLTDAQRLLVEIRKRPQRYQILKAMLGRDPERTLNALDRLDGLGLVRRRIINGCTHFAAMADGVDASPSE